MVAKNKTSSHFLMYCHIDNTGFPATGCVCRERQENSVELDKH